MPHDTMDLPGDYIGGRFVNPKRADGELAIYSPADLERLVARHQHADEQVDLAIDAARDALPQWRRLAPERRAQFLRAYQERLRAHREDIATTIAHEVGKPMWEARTEADALVSKVDVMLGEGAAYTADQRVEGVGEIRYRPHGVLAVIGPFNFPGHLPNGQIIPALALGNTVVHKPSPLTPSTATWMARCFDEAGLPAGVFNVVQGDASAGQCLVVHPGVNGVLFTGSLGAGRKILAELSDDPGRIVALELGGKNASIVLDDCNLEATARQVVFAAFATAGQRCTSTSRLIVTRRVADELISRLCQLTQRLVVGYPFDDEVFMGPLISADALDRVIEAQAQARLAGFSPLLPGGPAQVGHQGHYLSPGLHLATTGDEQAEGYSDAELFGPDLMIHVVDDLEAAAVLANNSPFGLSAAVFTASRDRFEEAADLLQVGVLHWNRATAGASGRLPFGGIRASGNHRPAGIMAGTSCAYPQAVLTPEPSDDLPRWPGLMLD